VAFTSYSPVYSAEKAGIAAKHGGLKIVADATSLAKQNSVIAAMPDAGIDEPQDLRGKTVAVIRRGTMAHILALAVLDQYGLTSGDVTYVDMPLPNTPAALANGQVDAAFLTEPFRTLALKDGAFELADTNTGQMEGIGLCGYVMLGNRVTADREAVAAFSRGMHRATDLATTDRRKVERILPEYTGMDPQLPSQLKYTRFEWSLNRERVEARVLRAMNQYLWGGEPGAEFWTPAVDMIVDPAPLDQ
jgi:NitT/TauT family transport system substrate-binding protein